MGLVGKHQPFSLFFLWLLCFVLYVLFPENVYGWRGSSGPPKDETNYYKILGVSKTASTAEIKKAYRKLSIQYHPDKNTSPGASDKFTQIASAYEVLNDKEKRSIYDEHGEEGLKRHQQGGDGGGMDPFNFFDHFGFGGGGRRRGNEKTKSPSLEMNLYLTLSQLYFGELLQIKFKRPVVCLKADDCLSEQKSCSGPGVKSITQRVGPGFFVQNQIQDDSCVDVGKSWDEACRSCPNGKTTDEITSTSIYVDPGMNDGDTIVFEGGGVQKLGHEPGDVIFKVAQMPHPSFKRQGDNLHTYVYLTLLEALVGFKKTFPHVSNENLVLQRTTVSHDGEIEIVHNKGMPIKNSVTFGDLYITYKVQYPNSLTPASQALITEALGSTTSWRYEQIKS